MKKFFQAILALFGKTGLQALVNAIVGTNYFKVFLKDLLVKQVAGLEKSHPELYRTLTQYAEVISNMPDILTDDNASNIEQLALELRLAKLAELETLFGQLKRVGEEAETSARRFRVSK